MDQRENAAADSDENGPGGGPQGGGEAAPGGGTETAGGSGNPPQDRGGAETERERQHTNGPGPTEVPPPPLTDAQICEHFLLRNIRYHEDRETFFGRINRFMSFFVLMSGLGTVAALAGKLPDWAKVDPALIAATTSTVGALQLVFGFTRTETIHAELRRRFLQLLVDMEDGNPAAVMKKARGLLPGEPPAYFAVNTLAYNAAQARFDRPFKYNKRVRFWQRWLRHIIRFSGTQFPRYEEIWERRAALRAAIWRTIKACFGR